MKSCGSGFIIVAMITIKSSFLRDLSPNIYDTLSSYKKYAVIYALVLLAFVVLSFFLQWDLINFFIGILMGKSVLAIAFIAIVVVALDKEVQINIPEYTWEKEEIKKSKSYKYTLIWGIALCIMGVTCLFYSNKYKLYYAFQCQTFYVDELNKIYHVLDDCDYVYDEEIKNNHSVYKEVKGVDIVDSDYILCDFCEDWAEFAAMSESERSFRRK